MTTEYKNKNQLQTNLKDDLNLLLQFVDTAYIPAHAEKLFD